MTFFVQKIKQLLLIFLITLFFPTSSFALAKFNTSYQVYYKVENNGNTHVTFVISQKNNLSIVYATEYGISLNETKLANLKILDEGTPVKPTINKTDTQTLISFPFSKKVVGKEKVRNFTIEYDTNEIVEKNGNTWQINIPRFEADENVTDQTAILTLPDKFPQPAYIDPKPDIINGQNYYFSSKVMANKPISAIFGSNQFYKGNIKYFLGNTGNTESTQTITLVPETQYQTIYYEKIEPKPIGINSDEDGNLLATYKLKPNQELNIDTKFFVKTSFLPQGKSESPSPMHLLPNKIWNYDDNLFTIPELKNLTSPKSIYDYLTTKLHYDYQKINKDGTIRVAASDSLKNYLSAICTDYADLFVTLARRAKVPAREIEGYAISDNQELKPIMASHDVLHAWAEYYDESKKSWIQVDPTWGSTTRGLDYFNKLDFNHITFAIHGQEPDRPLPAGAFKKQGNTDKEIILESIEEISFPVSTFKIKGQKISTLKPEFVIENPTGTYLYVDVKVSLSNTIEDYSSTISVPPFSQKTISLRPKKASLWGNTDTEVIININGQPTIFSLTNKHLFQKTGLFAGICLLLGVGTLLSRRLLLRRSK